jgi:uncharacterized UPF0146 family protein
VTPCPVTAYLAPRAPERAVEVGIGHDQATAQRLLKHFPTLELVGTDIDPAALRAAAPPGLRLVHDDLRNPRMTVYHGADLVYAVRPNPEMAVDLANLARRIDCPLLVIPLEEDAPSLAGWFQPWVLGSRVAGYISSKAAGAA